MIDDDDNLTETVLSLEATPVIPGYLMAPEAIRAEARRAYALNLIFSCEGTPGARWREELVIYEAWLRDGTLPAETTEGTNKRASLRAVQP